MQNLIFPDVKPNVTHYALAKLEEMGKLKAIVTQNIDGLHQAAGSKEVYEIHGTISKAHCMECGKEYPLEYSLDKSNWKEGTYTPLCSCGGVLKPDVVLYEEPLDNELIMKSVKAISEADTLIIGGTSLVVYPAASFVTYFKGKHLILINKQETAYDKNADIVIHDSLGKVFSNVVDGINL
jgi:NAD-dependent deacetylase